MTSIHNTHSLCPVCLARLPAVVVKREHDYFLEKTCREHGFFSTVIWRGDAPALEDWGNYTPPSEPQGLMPDCPHDCGLCAGHLRETCCALVEITDHCNLKCPICFAQSGEAFETSDKAEPPIAELEKIFRDLASRGRTFVQLSGGEPTVRDDLPEIVRAAKAMGCETVQLNSNGLRLGNEKSYARKLAEAGLSFIFMQFDGTKDEIYEKLRGRPLLAEKLAAINACAEARLGVALVPTIVPGVNDDNIGDMLNFAIANSPAVRGVHFQPVSYFGRYPSYPAPSMNESRITLPEILRAMERQTDGIVRTTDLLPSACDHPRCGFHGDFVVLPNGVLRRLTPEPQASCCGNTAADADNAHIKNRKFVARRWTRQADEVQDESCCCSAASEFTVDAPDLDVFLNRVRSHGFTITAMAFQDAWTVDLERLRRCSLHVYKNGRVVPFCSNYLMAENSV